MKEKEENLVLKAKKDTTFFQMGSAGDGMCSMFEGFAKKGTIFLASAAYRRHIPLDDFEILGTVEVKKDVDICPCCVSSTKFFEVSNYPKIVHINELSVRSLGWRDKNWVINNSVSTIRGLEMIGR